MHIPDGFKFGSAACGIKSEGNDLGLIVANANCTSAGVYTTNLVRASCIDQNAAKTPTASLRSIVVNSGNANACTGELGEQNSRQMASSVASAIGCNAEQVLVLSTGVIGQQLPMENINSGIMSAAHGLNNTPEDIDGLAHAFMTTDKFLKVVSSKSDIGGNSTSILGIAKGAGMIGPNMATMLSVILTDATLSPDQAQRFLKSAVDESFNRISVDGHTSTNDAVLLLASGTGTAIEGSKAMQLQDQITSQCIDLAKMIPTDGEGASHLIEIRVTGTDRDEQADRIARVVAASNLVKTAISGCDPNWGRIVSAVGYAGVQINPRNISLSLCDTPIYESGSPSIFDESNVSQAMVDQKEIPIHINVGDGEGKSVHWTSDLTTDYVKLNADYRT